MGVAPPPHVEGYGGIVRGAEDSLVTTNAPGGIAPYRYRFRQIEPASDRFTFQDRDLSFFFKPAVAAIHFQVENRQANPVWIEWDRSVFHAPLRQTGKVAHSSTRWNARNAADPPTQIMGLQRYGDYVFPMDYLVNPVGSSDQLHRSLLPQDETAPHFKDMEFGVDLVFRIEGKMRVYPVRFRVDAVLPNE